MTRRRSKKPGDTAVCVVLLLVACQVGFGQDRSPKRAILGVWRGVSLCTKVTGNEACHDETVIYRFEDSSHGPNMISANADKIVNGEVIPMFGFDIAYDSTTDQSQVVLLQEEEP